MSNNKKHYYEFVYFFSKKDSGSIYIATDTTLDVFCTDECIDYAYKHGLLDKEFINNIISVDEIDEVDAKHLAFREE